MKDRKTHMMLMAGAVMVCLMMGLATAAQAANVAAGLGVGLAPDYEGSEDYEGVPIPYLNVRWENHMSLNWLGGKAKLNLIPSPFWRGGVVGEYIEKRNDVDNNAVDRLPSVGNSFMLGGFFGFQYNNLSADIEAMQDVADGNDGAIIRLNGSYRIPIDETWTLSLGAFTTWADDDYMQSYFEVTAAGAAASGLAIYDADAGFKDVGLNFTASFTPWERWGLMGLFSYKRLLGDAEDSPVVDDAGDANQLFGGVLVFYRF